MMNSAIETKESPIINDLVNPAQQEDIPQPQIGIPV